MGIKRHRNERAASKLRRKVVRRLAYDRVLIVCEGSKTEPQYFEEIRQFARIPSADIRVIPSGIGTDPLSVVTFALEQFAALGKSFERVYAVFDRDDHASYANAIAKSKSVKATNDERKAVQFDAAVSVPCFELWFLLHFQDVPAYHHRDVIMEKLKVHVPAYDKGKEGMFGLLRPSLENATTRANWLNENYCRLPGTDSYTDVHRLVSFLITIKPNINVP
jgi:hypothetical protein